MDRTKYESSGWQKLREGMTGLRKKFGPDENLKPYHTLFCRNINICRDLHILKDFGQENLLFFLGQIQCLLRNQSKLKQDQDFGAY